MDQIDRSFEETKAFLLGAIDYEKISKYTYNTSSFNLNRMEQLLDVAGNPHRNLKTIHVAGTKGKGSTANMIATILQGTGLNVGLFTSPHLINLEERIKINGKEIPQEAFVESTEILRPFIETEREKDMQSSPTFFETLTAIALIYFRKEAVDLAVMEVGLGGRLDSTNIIEPLVSVITNIGFDHVDKLGYTLDKIAMEKAGIIKERVPVVSSPQEEEALNVIEDTCTRKNSQLTLVGRDIMIENVRPPEGQYNALDEYKEIFGSFCDLSTEKNHYKDLFVPLPGRHQVENCACAIGAVEIAIESFPDKGIDLPKEDSKGSVHNSLKSVKCPGRIEVVSSQPLTIVDSAHTVESILSLRDTIEEYFKPSKITLMFGMSEDKDIEGVLSAILPYVDSVIFTTTGNPRSANPADLHKVAKKKFNKPSYVDDDIREAFDIAMRVTEESDIICITGSMFLAGEVKSLVENTRY